MCKRSITLGNVAKLSFGFNWALFLSGAACLVACLLLIAGQPAVGALNESPFSIPVSPEWFPDSDPFTIPRYNPLDSTHFLVDDKTKWTKSNLNDPRYEHFYVVPGTYGHVSIDDSSGNKSDARSISLINYPLVINDYTHPGKLDTSKQASVSLTFDGVKYWVVDRMSSIDHTDLGYAFIVENGSQNIVLNRLYMDNFHSGIAIYGTEPDEKTPTSDITVQNSRIQNQYFPDEQNDFVAIALRSEKETDYFANPDFVWHYRTVLRNTKILNNEIYNTNDGVHVVRVPSDQSPDDNIDPNIDGLHDVNYPGTIIDYNHIYVDENVYTDGKGGDVPKDEEGKYALTENAVDLKAGSSDPNNPIIVSNNFFWGFRTTDGIRGGSGGDSPAIAVHFGVDNLEIKNNVIFNSNRSISIIAPKDAEYSARDVSIFGNIMHNIGHDPNGDVEYAHYAYASKDVELECNTIVGVDKRSRWWSHKEDEDTDGDGVIEIYDAENLTIKKNVVINSDEMTGPRHLPGDETDTVVEDNFFYGTEQQSKPSGGTYNDGTSYTSARMTARMTGLTFTTDTYTNSPWPEELPGVVSTIYSPHVARLPCGCVPVSSDPFGVWDLDEGSGFTAGDPVGDHDGSLIGNVTWTQEPPPVVGLAGSVQFGGDGYINFGPSPELSPASIGVSVWAKATGDHTNFVLLSKHDSYELGFVGDGPDSRLYFHAWGANGAEVFAGQSANDPFTADEFHDGQWHHLLATVSETTGDVTLLVDSVLVETLNWGAGQGLNATDHPLLAGRSGFPGPGVPYYGQLGSMRIYEVAPIPEPTRYSLMVLGFVGWTMTRGRRSEGM